MSNCFFWRIEYHSWSYPAHDLTNLFTLLWRITVCRAVLAGSLILSIPAMVETATSEFCQMLVFIRHSVLLQPMTAIKFYHPSDGLLFALYSTRHSNISS